MSSSMRLQLAVVALAAGALLFSFSTVNGRVANGGSGGFFQSDFHPHRHSKKGAHHHHHKQHQNRFTPAARHQSNAEILRKLAKSKMWRNQMPPQLRNRIRDQILNAKTDLVANPQVNQKLLQQYNQWMSRLDSKSKARAVELSKMLKVVSVVKHKKSKKSKKGKDKKKVEQPQASTTTPPPPVKNGSEEAHRHATSTSDTPTPADSAVPPPPRSGSFYSFSYSKNSYDPYAGAKEGMYEKMHPEQKAQEQKTEEKKCPKSQQPSQPSTSRHTTNVRETDYYNKLGIQPGASESEIRRGYKLTALKTHPDKNGGCDKAFKAMKRAYDVLINPECRRLYDSFGEFGVERQKCI